MPDNPETLQAYSRHFPESAELIDVHSWLKWLYREQFRQNGCSAEVTDTETPAAQLKMTQAWPVATTQSSTVQLLRELVKLPFPAHYLLTSGQHTIALSVEKDHLTLFDQNAPCYFLRVERTRAEHLANSVFHAISAHLNCKATVDGRGATVECGPYGTFLPAPESGSLDWNDVEQAVSELNHKHPLAVWSLQAVMPTNTAAADLQEAEWRVEWLTGTLMNTLPTHINASDAKGFTRLHLSSRSGNSESVKALLKAGADPTQDSLEGYSAYDMACRFHPDTAALIKEHLLAKGIHPQCQQNEHPPGSLELAKPWHDSSQPIPDNLFQSHQQTLQEDYYNPSASLPASSFSHDHNHGHCASNDCGSISTDNSWESFKFRKALGTIGRGEDLLSRFVDRVEQVQDNVVRLVTDRHPTLQAISVSTRQAAGSIVAEQVDLLDRVSGRVISQSWNNLDPSLKDELNGVLKIAAVVPGGKGLSTLAGRGKYFQEALSKARPIGNHPGQLMYVVNDGTKIIFRKDFGDKAHPLGGPFIGKGKIDHYNIEIQNSKGRTIENLHAVPDEEGSLVVWGKNGVIKQ